MPRHLPPLTALRAFEAAARHASFSKAGEELCVTQGAISKQINILESYLDVTLFERRGSRIVMTQAGNSYLPAVSAAFDAVNEATLRLIPAKLSRQKLTLDAIPSLASLWLIPRLNNFQVTFPHIQVELTAGDGPINFANSEADLAIRCLQKSCLADAPRLLFNEKLILVATDEYLHNHPVNEVSDLLQQRVIPQTTRPALWDQFLQNLGFSKHNLQYSIRSEHFFISLQSVRAGLGLGLIPDFLIRDDLRTGKLKQVLRLSYVSDYGYFILCPGYKIKLQKVQNFISWLEAQISGKTDETDASARGMIIKSF